MNKTESVAKSIVVDEQANTRYESADNLRFLATVAVIMVHVSAFSRTSGLNVDLFYGNISRFCVPVFVMLTGALLLCKSYELPFFIRSKFVRILLPFIFWSSIYLAHEMHQYITEFPDAGIKLLLVHAFEVIRGPNTLAPHLWYIYMIIGLYLFIPLISKAARAATNQEIQFYLLIWFVMLFFEFKEFSLFKIDFDLRYFTGYLGYLILGYYLFNRVNYSFTRLGVLLVITGLVATGCGTYLLSQREGHFNHSFYEYLTPNVAVYATGVFLLVQRLSNYQLPKSLLKLRTFVSNHSYGIYLVHWIILLSFDKFGLNSKSFFPFLSIPLITFLFLSLSGCIVWTIRKIPFGKYISG